MNLLRKIANHIEWRIMRRYYIITENNFKQKMGYYGKNVQIAVPEFCSSPKRIFMYDNTNIYSGFNFISYTGAFIMKKNSGSAQGLTVITGNHHRIVGEFIKESIIKRTEDIEEDIIVEEDVWIGANVTLLDGCHIGRGANIGAGATVRFKVPPYAIVIGNPAKIVGFSFSPEEVKEHEEKLYPPKERIDFSLYETNYNKLFIKNIQAINAFLRSKP